MTQPQWLTDWLRPVDPEARAIRQRLAARRLLRPYRQQAALRGVQTRRGK